MIAKLISFFERSLAILFWVLLMLGFDAPYITVLTVSAAVIHELGHIIAAFCISGSVRIPRGDISGFRIKMSGLSYKEELIVALGGPLINILLGVILLKLPFPKTALPYLRTFGILNIMTAISNLLPIESYDGHKALLCLAAIFTSRHLLAEAIMHKLSFGFCAVMCFLSLYLILKLGEGYWLFAVFFSVLLSSIIKRQKQAFCENT